MCQGGGRGEHPADWTDAWAQAFSGHRGATCVDGSLTFVLRGKAWHFAPDDPEVPLSTTPFYSTTPPCAGRGHVTCLRGGAGRQPALMVHHKADPALTARGWSFLQTLSKVRDAAPARAAAGVSCCCRGVCCVPEPT